MNVYVPFAFTTIVPTPGIVAVVPALYVTPLIVNEVTDKVFPSASVSFVKTFPEIGVSSFPETTSSVATGASFTGVTVMFNIPVPEPPFVSVAVYVIAGTVPL